MRSVDWEEESKRFDEASDYYDIYRPGYPDELIRLIERKACLHPQSRIIEIGAGSGKASEMLLNKGYQLTCIEPGARLAQVGMTKHRGKRLEYIITRFEHWTEPKDYYDLAFSAQAFHWVLKPIGYQKCANTLKSKGYLALFWNMYLDEGGFVYKELVSICKQYGVVPFQSLEDIESRIEQVKSELSTNGYFEAPSIARFPWSQLYNVEQFIGFLRTGNGYLALAEIDRANLNHAVAGALSKSGEQVAMKFICTLFLTRKLN
jgi:cyclopropane fatty-acyl-phospholipid synthase-like methyltransferase